jgi:HK97 family phage major capsid protein
VIPKLTDLQADLAHKQRVAQEILAKSEKESRIPSTEENALFDDLCKQVENLETQIKNMVEFQERQEKLEAMKKKADESQRKTLPAPVENTKADRIPAVARRTGTLKAFRNDHDGEQKAYRAGKWLRAHILKDERAAQWCQQHGVYNVLSTTDNASAGYLVPDEFSQAIIDLREKYGVFRQNTRVQPMGSDSMLIPRRVGGVTVAFVGENAEISASDPTWNQVSLNAKKLAGLSRMSTEVDADAIIDLADALASEFAYAFALKEDQCGFNGDGTSTYGGISGLTSAAKLANENLAGAVTAASGHDIFSEIDMADLSAVMAALPEYAKNNAKWYCSSVCWEMVFSRLLVAGGGNTIMDLQGKIQRNFLGYPVVISQVLPSGVSTDYSEDVMLLFGDLSLSTTMGDRRGISVMQSEHRWFELDQIGVRATERVDIVNHDVGDTSTAGPMVSLVGE